METDKQGTVGWPIYRCDLGQLEQGWLVRIADRDSEVFFSGTAIDGQPFGVCGLHGYVPMPPRCECVKAAITLEAAWLEAKGEGSGA